ncbi:MAG: hypothetical protein ACYCZQ_14240 [Burkholderiales bacterium]
MVKNIIVFGLIAIGIYYFGFRKTDLDTLMKPATELAADTEANIFVKPDYRNAPIHDQDYVVNKAFTVVYYHQNSCTGCQRLDGDLGHFLALRKDVAIRKIELEDSWVPADFTRNIGLIPFIVIYGPDGKMIRADDAQKQGAFKLLYDWMNAEFKKEYDHNQGK